MKRFRLRALPACVAALAIALGGCERTPTDPEGRPGEPVSLNFSAQLDGAAEVQMLAVEVSAADIPRPLVANFPVVDGAASGRITVPVGDARTFTARAFDREGAVTHEGSVTQDVRRNQPVVRIPLLPLGAGVPIQVGFSSFSISIDPTTAALQAGETRQFTATVLDGEGREVQNPTLTWATSNPAVATVDAQGRVTARVAGSTRVVVSFNGLAADAEVTVDGGSGSDLLEITVTTAQTSVASGGDLRVTTTVRNRGSAAVGNVTFSVVVTGATRASWMSDQSRCNVFPAAGPDGEIEGTAFYCGIAPTGWPDNALTFMPGDSYTETMGFRISEVCREGVRVSGTIISWNGPADPYLANNQVAFDVPVDCPPDLLEISLASTSSSVAPGGTFPVSATVANHGTQAVRDVRFSVGSWPIQGMSLGEPDCGASIFDYADRQGQSAWPCHIPELAAGSSVTFRFTLQTDPSLCVDAVSTVASLFDWTGPADPYPLNNRDSLAVAVACPQSVNETARIAYVVESDGPSDLYTRRPAGTDERRVSSGGSDAQPAWSPDRTRLAFVRGGRIWTVSATGSPAPTQLTAFDAQSPAWSPNGAQIAVSTRVNSATPRIRILSATTGATVREVTDENADTREPHWSPDGTRLVVVRGTQNRITVIGAETGSLISEHGTGWNPKWSPDGTRVAFWRGEQTLSREVFVVNVATGVETRIAAGSHPSWSPNGSYLVFQHFQGDAVGADGPVGKPDLLIIRADGTGVRHNITNRPNTGDVMPAW
jgi:hypothetical protein